MAKGLEIQPAQTRGADVLSPTVPKEQPTPQNSFVDFIGENWQELTGLSSLTHDLRDEEAGWRSSPSFEYLVGEGISITQQSRGTINSKIESQMRRLLTDAVFGSQDSKRDAGKGIIDRLSSAYMRLDPEQKRQLVDWETKTEELGNAYREARRAILSPLRETRRDLLAKCTEYLLVDYSHLFDFGEFLSSPSFRSHRESVRPFLVSLAENDSNARRERREGIFDRVRATWVNRTREDLLAEILPRWIKTVMASSKRRDLEVAGWLRMVAKTAKLTTPDSQGDLQGEEIREGDIIGILQNIIEPAQWPSELRGSYRDFGSNEVLSVVATIQRLLEQFSTTKPQVPSSVVIFEARPKKRDQRRESLPQVGSEVGEEPVVEAGKRPYIIGIIKKRVHGRTPFVSLLNEGELAKFLARRADQIAKGDTRARSDIEAIIANLRGDPYGLGTKKLVARTAAVGSTSFGLRRLNPGERINLPPFEYEQSGRLRVVYVICRNGEDQATIALYEKGIYTHDEYDREFES